MTERGRQAPGQDRGTPGGKERAKLRPKRWARQKERQEVSREGEQGE